MSFLWMWMTHPVQLASAAVDGYFSKRDTDIDELRRTGLSCHVLWAADDEILSRQDGEDFARRLNASFTLAEQPPGDAPLTHDWIIDRPELFVTYLDKLGLRILRQAHDLGDSTTPQSRHT